MIRHGTVLVFKRGVTPDEAAAAIEKIKEVLDLPEVTHDTVPVGTNRRGQRMVKMVDRPFVMEDAVHEFDDYDGCAGPVWYIP